MNGTLATRGQDEPFFMRRGDSTLALEGVRVLLWEKRTRKRQGAEAKRQGDILGKLRGSEGTGQCQLRLPERGGQGSHLPQGSQSALQQWDRHLHLICVPHGSLVWIPSYTYVSLH